MSWETFIILIIIGFSAGFIGGLLGVGGGIVVIPALVFILGMSQQNAQGTNLAMMIPPIGILAAINYYKQGQVNIKFALILALAFIIGGYFGSKVSVNVNEMALKRIFGVFLLLLAAKMIYGK